MQLLRVVREEDGMAAIREEERHVSVVGDRLADAIRETARPYVGGQNLDAVVGALVKVLRAQFVVGIRKPKPRRQTERAISMRLPAVGVTWTYSHKGKRYVLTVTGEHELTVECDGAPVRFESLKAAAKAILGYQPSVGGWRFFFGTAEHDEVARRHKR